MINVNKNELNKAIKAHGNFQSLQNIGNYLRISTASAELLFEDGKHGDEELIERVCLQLGLDSKDIIESSEKPAKAKKKPGRKKKA